jgi:hypothetical protein
MLWGATWPSQAEAQRVSVPRAFPAQALPAEAYRIVVEEQKLAAEQGLYLNPSLYGHPKTNGLRWAGGEWMPQLAEHLLSSTP